jgi:hypothetical protein
MHFRSFPIISFFLLLTIPFMHDWPQTCWSLCRKKTRIFDEIQFKFVLGEGFDGKELFCHLLETLYFTSISHFLILALCFLLLFRDVEKDYYVLYFLGNLLKKFVNGIETYKFFTVPCWIPKRGKGSAKSWNERRVFR